MSINARENANESRRLSTTTVNANVTYTVSSLRIFTGYLLMSVLEASPALNAPLRNEIISLNGAR